MPPLNNRTLTLHQAVDIRPPSIATGGKWTAFHSESGKTFSISIKTVALLLTFAGNRTVKAGESVEALEKNRLLVPPNENQAISWRRAWQKAGWENAARYYDLIRRIAFVDYAAGGREIDATRMHMYAANDSEPPRSKNYGKQVPRFPLPTPNAAAINLTAYQGPPGWEELASIVSLTFGKTGEGNLGLSGLHPTHMQKTSPSNGARHPTEGYLFLSGMAGLTDGWYHIESETPCLEWIASGGPVKERNSEVKILVLLTTRVERSQYRYRDPRSFTTLFLDAGHLWGTLQALCASVGWRLHRKLIKGRNELSSVLGLTPGEEECLYFFSIDSMSGNEKVNEPTRANSTITTPSIETILATPGTVIQLSAELELAGMRINSPLLDVSISLPSEELLRRLNLAPPSQILSEEICEWYDCGWGPALEHWQWCKSEEGIGSPIPVPPELPLSLKPFPETTALDQSKTLSTRLLGRRTARLFQPDPISYESLGQILTYAFGDFPATPMLSYLVCHRVCGLLAGLHEYFPSIHSTSLKREGNFQKQIAAALANQANVQNAAFTLLLVADFKSFLGSANSRQAFLDLFADAGHLAQRTLIAGTALGLSGFVTHGISVAPLETIITFEVGKTFPLYSVSIGWPQSKQIKI